MRKLNEILGDVRDLLSPRFGTVRISAAQISEQLLTEIRAISPANLPAVVIVHQRTGFTHENTAREHTFTLVLIDRYTAGSDERALSLAAALETLYAVFPPDGVTAEEVTYYPGEALPASADSAYACLAVTLTAKQGC